MSRKSLIIAFIRDVLNAESDKTVMVAVIIGAIGILCTIGFTIIFIMEFTG